MEGFHAMALVLTCAYLSLSRDVLVSARLREDAVDEIRHHRTRCYWLEVTSRWPERLIRWGWATGYSKSLHFALVGMTGTGFFGVVAGPSRQFVSGPPC